jgi:hypothetical protein
MSAANLEQDIDFSVDRGNLYREVTIGDLEAATIKIMMPVKPDGTDDPGRVPLFFGMTQLLTHQGPIPIQSVLEANSLEEAITCFPGAMKRAMAEMIENIEKMQQQQQQRQKDASRIIVPGR